MISDNAQELHQGGSREQAKGVEKPTGTGTTLAHTGRGSLLEVHMLRGRLISSLLTVLITLTLLPHQVRAGESDLRCQPHHR